MLKLPEKESEVSVYFVYGTLCRGQCRQRCWPKAPLIVIPAWVEGTLYGRADYPAMRPGNDRIGGECWFYPAADASAITAVLDEIEGTDQPGSPPPPNLYDRVSVRANLLRPIPGDTRTQWMAQAYHYACDPFEDGFVRLHPHSNGQVVTWPNRECRENAGGFPGQVHPFSRPQ